MIYKIRCAICHMEASAVSSVSRDSDEFTCEHGYFFIDAGSPPCVRYAGDFDKMEFLDKEGEWKPFVTGEVSEIAEENFVSKQLKWDLSKLSGTWKALEYVERLEAQVKDYEQVLKFFADNERSTGYAQAREILEKYRKK